jgi:hypothetical protein
MTILLLLKTVCDSIKAAVPLRYHRSRFGPVVSIHALVSEGVFLPEKGAFLPLPKLATEPFLKLGDQELFALLLAEGKITEDVVQNIRSWQHSGFSVPLPSYPLSGSKEQIPMSFAGN